MSVGVSVHGSIKSSGLLVQGNKSYTDLFKTSHSLPRVVAAQVYRSQQVGQSEDSLIGVLVHSSRVGAVPVSSESPSSILDVSAGAVVSISLAVSMVGQGSKVGSDSVSPLVSFAQPIVSSVVSVDELDDRVGIVSPSVEMVVLRNGSGSSYSPILDVDSDVQVKVEALKLECEEVTTSFLEDGIVHPAIIPLATSFRLFDYLTEVASSRVS
ncbi:hypothetical protein LWI29_004607 [Acer saccharum]|uniref:Uncharacterized protein n=1 Tax=Acer saccharum TaxID=4024 RepID=A0AA39RMR4_ACESA|nr:hypothetical protein LWI29_004607 [Acer saccharum]